MISGSLVALVTPMDSRGNLDWEALDRLIEFHLAEGTDGIVAVGTSGESATLDFDEHKEVIRRVVDRVAGRIPVIAGAGTITTILSLRAEIQTVNILVAIALNMIVVVVVLLLTNRIERLLGRVGLIVLRKAFGIILLAIAVKLFAGNITYLFPD